MNMISISDKRSVKILQLICFYRKAKPMKIVGWV